MVNDNYEAYEAKERYLKYIKDRINFSSPLSEEDFSSLMTELQKFGCDDEDDVDVQIRHEYMDCLMSNQLSALGFGTAMLTYIETEKWYA